MEAHKHVGMKAIRQPPLPRRILSLFTFSINNKVDGIFQRWEGLRITVGNGAASDALRGLIFQPLPLFTSLRRRVEVGWGAGGGGCFLCRGVLFEG